MEGDIRGDLISRKNRAQTIEEFGGTMIFVEE
jgi:hypothetical protein